MTPAGIGLVAASILLDLPSALARLFMTAVIVGLARWQEERGLIEPRRDPLGVRLKPGDPVEQIAGDLERLAVVALEFPKFNDGRAMSQARLLRERYGYRGEIRATGKVVRTNREHPPDFINIKVEELTGDKPFDNLDDFITQDELRALSDSYKRIAGFAVADVAKRV